MNFWSGPMATSAMLNAATGGKTWDELTQPQNALAPTQPPQNQPMVQPWMQGILQSNGFQPQASPQQPQQPQANQQYPSWVQGVMQRQGFGGQPQQNDQQYPQWAQRMMDRRGFSGYQGNALGGGFRHPNNSSYANGNQDQQDPYQNYRPMGPMGGGW